MVTCGTVMYECYSVSVVKMCCSSGEIPCCLLFCTTVICLTYMWVILAVLFVCSPKQHCTLILTNSGYRFQSVLFRLWLFLTKRVFDSQTDWYLNDFLLEEEHIVLLYEMTFRNTIPTLNEDTVVVYYCITKDVSDAVFLNQHLKMTLLSSAW